MKSQISISFIIPYYNIERHLLIRCLNSVIMTMNGCNVKWEAVIIDDGSNNNIAKDCIKELKCSNIIYFYQNNSGLSVARNKGLEIAVMQYIHFLDADDYIYPSAFKKLIELIQDSKKTTYDIDLLAFNYHFTHNRSLNDYKNKQLKIKYNGSGINFMLKYNLHSSACCYLFKKNVLGNLRFAPGILHEDEDFTPKLFLRCKRICVCNIKAYAYYQRSDSILHNYNETQLRKRYSDLINIIEEQKNESESSLNANFKKALARRKDILSSDVIYRLVNESPTFQFLKQNLYIMKAKGLFPIKISPHSLRYIIIALISENQYILYITYTIIRTLRLTYNRFILKKQQKILQIK